MAYFECLHEVKLIADLIHEGCIANELCGREHRRIRRKCHRTADHHESAKAEMKRVLSDIQSGRLTCAWVLENEVNQTSFKAMRAKAAALQIEEVGARLRAMTPWIGANKLVDKEKN